MKFSFIHTADIHLGRAFSDIGFVLNDEQAAILKTAHEKAFLELVDFAISRAVDFVLIAGDTFDDFEKDLRAKLILSNALKRLDANNIQVFMVCGNHDPRNSYSKDLSFKDSTKIHIFGVNTPEESKIVTINDVEVAMIHPFGFTTNECRYSPCQNLVKATSKSLFNIGLIHCDATSANNVYAPCTERELTDLSYDYYALGHIHKPFIKNNLVYPGTIQGRSKKDDGEHGFRFVTVEDNKIISNEFIVCDKVRYYNYEFDLSGVSNEMEMVEKATIELLGLSKNCELAIIDVTISGCREFKINNYSEILSALSINNLIISDINDRSYEKINTEILLNADGVLGLMMNSIQDENIIKRILEKTKKELNELLKYSFQDFDEDVLVNSKNEIKNICSEIFYNNEIEGADNE